MLRGDRVLLREATERDRRQIYGWLAESDLTSSMMGPPQYPENPIPTWEQFCRDYRPHYFDGSQPHAGRCFVIVADGMDVGVVSYNALRTEGITDVDIWLRSEADCGRGFGSDALRVLTNYLHREFGVVQVAIAPSARNHRAIAAYQKAGFRLVSEEAYHHFVNPEDMECRDTVVLVKEYAARS